VEIKASLPPIQKIQAREEYPADGAVKGKDGRRKCQKKGKKSFWKLWPRRGKTYLGTENSAGGYS